MGLSYGGGFRSARVPRPAPTSWQDEQEQNAQSQWDAQGSSVFGDQSRAAGRRDSSASTADSAYNSFTQGGSPNVAAFTPEMTKGYAPSQIASWQAGAAGAANLASGKTSAAGAFGSDALKGFKSSALEGFDSSDVSGFDPSAAGKEYAQGAYGDFQNSLSDELKTLRNNSAGGGRLNTGWFDQDRGNVVTRLGSDFSNKIAQSAVDFSGQRLNALESGAGMRLSRAQGIDSNMLARDQGIDANTLRAAEDQDQFSTARDQTGLEYSRMGLQAATEADKLGYQRASDVDSYGFNRAKYLDDQSFARGQTGLDAALSREKSYMGDYNTQADRAGDYVSSTRNWAAQDREAQDARDLQARRSGYGQPAMAGGTPYRGNDAGQSWWYKLYGGA